MEATTSLITKIGLYLNELSLGEREGDIATGLLKSLDKGDLGRALRHPDNSEYKTLVDLAREQPDVLDDLITDYNTWDEARQDRYTRLGTNDDRTRAVIRYISSGVARPGPALAASAAHGEPEALRVRGEEEAIRRAVEASIEDVVNTYKVVGFPPDLIRRAIEEGIAPYQMEDWLLDHMELDESSSKSLPSVSVELVEVLPSNWEASKTGAGRVYYRNHTTRTTQWEHPRIESERLIRSADEAYNAALLSSDIDTKKPLLLKALELYISALENYINIKDDCAETVMRRTEKIQALIENLTSKSSLSVSAELTKEENSAVMGAVGIGAMLDMALKPVDKNALVPVSESDDGAGAYLLPPAPPGTPPAATHAEPTPPERPPPPHDLPQIGGSGTQYAYIYDILDGTKHKINSKDGQRILGKYLEELKKLNI